MRTEHILWFAGGILVGWLVIPMVLGLLGKGKNGG